MQCRCRCGYRVALGVVVSVPEAPPRRQALPCTAWGDQLWRGKTLLMLL